MTSSRVLLQKRLAFCLDRPISWTGDLRKYLNRQVQLSLQRSEAELICRKRDLMGVRILTAGDNFQRRKPLLTKFAPKDARTRAGHKSRGRHMHRKYQRDFLTPLEGPESALRWRDEHRASSRSVQGFPTVSHTPCTAVSQTPRNVAVGSKKLILACIQLKARVLEGTRRASALFAGCGKLEVFEKSQEFNSLLVGFIDMYESQWLFWPVA